MVGDKGGKVIVVELIRSTRWVPEASQNFLDYRTEETTGYGGKLIALPEGRAEMDFARIHGHGGGREKLWLNGDRGDKRNQMLE